MEMLAPVDKFLALMTTMPKVLERLQCYEIKHTFQQVGTLLLLLLLLLLLVLPSKYLYKTLVNLTFFPFFFSKACQ